MISKDPKEQNIFIITGATGYLASSLLNHWTENNLIPDNSKLYLIDRHLKKDSLHPDIIQQSDKYKLIELDLNYTEELEEAMSHLKDHVHEYSNVTCVHTAYTKHLGSEKNFIDKIAELSKQIYFIYFSSSAVYGEPEFLNIKPDDIENIKQGKTEKRIKSTDPTNPISDYGKYKLELENYIQAKFDSGSKKVLILRISNPYAKEPDLRGAYAIFKNKLANDEVIELNTDSPDQIVRDFIHVDELCSRVTELKESSSSGIYNICSGQGSTLEVLIAKLHQELVEQGHSIDDPHIIYKGYRDGDIRYSVLNP